MVHRPRLRLHAAEGLFFSRRPLESNALWQALALVLVIEGLLPFISPGRWRRTFEQILQLSDGQLRFFGLCSVGLGLLGLWLLT